MAKRTDKRAQFLADVLTTAVEGGTNYWASVSGYVWDFERHEGTVHDTRATLHDEEDGGKEYALNLDVIAKGMGKMRQYLKDADPGHYWRQGLLADRTNGEEGDYDAEFADAVVQYGLLGELVYG